MRLIVAVFATSLVLMAPATVSVTAAPAVKKVKCKVTQAKFRAYVHGVYHRDKITDKALRKIVRDRGCAKSPKAARNMLKYHRAQGKARRDRALANSLTPFVGPDGARYAIPWYIVKCESGGSWSAYNASGAAGVYQIMAMHGRPWPASSASARVAHHRIAARLWNGGRGASNWICA